MLLTSRIWSIAMLLLISGTALGATLAVATGPAPAEAPQPQQTNRIQTDQETGAIRFIVNGREEARIDATGLHVRQGVVYGGPLTHVGVSGYDMPAKPEPKH